MVEEEGSKKTRNARQFIGKSIQLGVDICCERVPRTIGYAVVVLLLAYCLFSFRPVDPDSAGLILYGPQLSISNGMVELIYSEKAVPPYSRYCFVPHFLARIEEEVAKEGLFTLELEPVATGETQTIHGLEYPTYYGLTIEIPFQLADLQEYMAIEIPEGVRLPGKTKKEQLEMIHRTGIMEIYVEYVLFLEHFEDVLKEKPELVETIKRIQEELGEDAAQVWSEQVVAEAGEQYKQSLFKNLYARPEEVQGLVTDYLEFLETSQASEAGLPAISRAFEIDVDRIEHEVSITGAFR